MAGTKSKSSSKAGSPLLGKYELGRLLGRGTFAKVYHARCLAGGDPVAVKVLDKPELSATGMAARVLREVSAMRRLRHPNVLRLHEVLATRSKVYLVMELAPGGDLLSRLASLPTRRLPEQAARRVFLQLVSALIYSHARGVFHRDVKPQNVLIDADGNLKVSDFGLAALPDSLRDDGHLHTACGTPAFTAPEVLRRKAYDGAKADAWSCGVILFVLLAGHLPFDDANIPDMCRKAHHCEYVVPRWVSQPASRLVSRLLDPNPATRPAVAELASHPWFKRSLSVDSQLGGLLGGQAERELAFQAPPALNAFDIISMSPGLDLSGLFDESRRTRKKRFMTTAAVGSRASSRTAAHGPGAGRSSGTTTTDPPPRAPAAESSCGLNGGARREAGGARWSSDRRSRAAAPGAAAPDAREVVGRAARGGPVASCRTPSVAPNLP